ncbi:MAG: MFS transporter, partial [Sciscionella sp.]
MSTSATVPIAPGSQVRKVALASLIGTTIEWYDFYIYGTAAALVFPAQFFPGFSPAAGVLASLATFAVGFASRPLGGFFFGHFGDRIGRKKMLVVTLLTMGIGTFLVGLMPNYAQAGLFAPLGLVILRFVQGFAVGGEWGGAVTMAVEHAPAAKRGFYGSWPQIGSPLGLVLATAIFDVVVNVPHDALQAWGWRIPFLLSAVLIVAGLIIRLRLFESPAFARVKAAKQQVKLPAAQVLRRHPGAILIAIGSFLAIEVVFYLVTVLTLSWGTKHADISRGTFLTGVLIAGCCMCVMMPIFGALSDRIGRRTVYAGGAI